MDSVSAIRLSDNGDGIRAFPLSVQSKTKDSFLYDQLSRALESEPTESNRDLQGLCRSLHGAFPNEVAKALGKRTSEFQKDGAPEQRSELDEDAPEPHPIDYDWRFSKVTADKLARLTASCGSVLCVGTPTVYHAIVERHGVGFLIDRNPLLAPYLAANDKRNFVIEDLDRVLPGDRRIPTRFAAAILDPPWYPAVYERWLARTIPFVRLGGTIFVALFRKFTRIEAELERVKLLDRFAAIGKVSFAFEAVYSTPRFEEEVLSRLKLPTLPNWRAADVIRIELFSHIRSWPFPCNPIEPVMTWRRFLDGKQVIAVVNRAGDRQAITYSPATPNGSFELVSVSARNPGRNKIAVWTSRNRAAAATGTQRIKAILASSESDASRSERRLENLDDKHVTARLAEDLKFAF